MITSAVGTLAGIASAIGSFIGTWGLPIYLGSVGISGGVQFINNRISNSRLIKKGNTILKSKDVNTVGERIKYWLKDNFFCFVFPFNLYKSVRNFVQKDSTTDDNRKSKLKDRGMLTEPQPAQPAAPSQSQQQTAQRQQTQNTQTVFQRRHQMMQGRGNAQPVQQQPVQQPQQVQQGITVEYCRQRYNELNRQLQALRANGAPIADRNVVIAEMRQYVDMAQRIRQLEALRTQRAAATQQQGPTLTRR